MELQKTNEPEAAAAPQAKIQKQGELEILIRARYPLIYVVSWEEQRVLGEVKRIAEKLNKKVFEWSVTMGVIPSGTGFQKQKDAATQDPLVALDNVVENVEPALYVFKDFHPFMKCQNMAIIRKLREIAESLKNTFKTIVICSPLFELPAELEKDVTVVDYDLPGLREMGLLLDRVVEQVKDNPKLKVDIANQVREQVIHSLLGLTLVEAENVLARTLVQNRCLNIESIAIINHEKKQIIRKSGLLEYYDSEENLNSVGGLDILKKWLIRRSVAFTENARKFGLPAPKGILLLGVQGCGKSLMAKAVSNIWQIPLLRLDIGKVFGSLVGSSEENIRRAIKVAESISPVILWLDEIDKAFRGSRSSGGNTDGGTSARVFGTFLTWLSEKKKPVFVVSTANDVTSLPPELLRKGRFDEIFFVDLPTQSERKDIFKVHLARRGFKVAEYDLDKLASVSGGFSGAEIEQAIISSMFNAFSEKKKLSTDILLTAIAETVPLSKTMGEDIETLRDWASGRAMRATSPETVDQSKDIRSLELG